MSIRFYGLVAALTAATLATARAEPVNHAPVADAGGPYLAALGQDLLLDGTGSFDADFPDDLLTSFLWDLDSDGSFDDASGAAIRVSWSTLFAILNPREGQTYRLALKVTDQAGAWGIDETTLTFRGGGSIPEPASIALVLAAGAGLAFPALRRRRRR